MGNTAERILDQVECSVLALKPASFACPIQLMDDEVAAKPF
jgi:universal stress protein E